MSYPFQQMPSFSDVKLVLESECGCEFVVEKNGFPFPISYFKRSHDGKNYKCVVDFKDDSEILTPSLLRSICARLDVHPNVFGLHLG